MMRRLRIAWLACVLASPVAYVFADAPATGGGPDAGAEVSAPPDAGATQPSLLPPDAGVPEAATLRSQADGPRCVLKARLEGVVTPAMADYLVEAVDAAEAQRCRALLVTTDTPGGMLDATRRIVQAFLGASVPVIVYVQPEGARAGSAGVFITLAAHVAVMAPATNIGAAHPVSLTGGDPGESGGKHMADKVENDAAALVRSIAERRGRNPQWAEAAVRESISATAREALRKNVIDVIAGSQQTLLERLDGRLVRVNGEVVRLQTANAALRDYEMSLQQRAQAILGDPTLSYILLMIGALGVMIEVYNPGIFIPGAVGAFCLLLAAIGLNVLPVNIGAVVLILVAVALFVAESQLPSFGMLTLAGIASLLLGGVLLIDEADPDFYVEPSVAVSWGAIIPMVLLFGGAAAALAWQASRTQPLRSPTGREGLLGERGRARTDIDAADGLVSVHGERWTAVADEPIAAGTYVRVVGTDGLVLRVKPEAEADGPTSNAT